MHPRLRAFSAADAPATSADLYALFDDLAAVDIATMFGDWDGDVLASGHPAEAVMRDLRWAGKTFRSREDVDPIVARDEAGRRFASPVMGRARLRMVEHRGVVSAAMIYDKHPIIDYFRRLDDDCLLGVMDRREQAPLFFTLTRRA